MNISWSSTDHLNGDVVDDASGQVLFHLATPYTLFKQGITTMTDGEGQVVAEYGSRLSHDQVTYKGQTRRVSDWFPADGFFTTTRRLHTPDGKTYLWKAKSFVESKLVDAQSEAIVARTRRSSGHNVIIEVGPEIAPFLDLIVLSFVICETEWRARWRRHKLAAGAVAIVS